MNDVLSVVQKTVAEHGIELVCSISNNKKDRIRPVYLVPTIQGTKVCFAVTDPTDEYIDLLVNVSKVKEFNTFIFDLQQELKILEGFEPEVRPVKLSKPSGPAMPITEQVFPTFAKPDEPMVQPKNLEGTKRDLRKEINQIARVPKNLYSGQIMALLTKIEEAYSADDLKLIKQELDATVKANIAAYAPVATKPVVSSATKSMAQKIQERRAEMLYM